MRIAIDTLFEHPDHPTGSLDYLRSLAGTFPTIGPEHDYYLLVSQRNIRHFREFERPNLHFLQCFRSNESLPLRMLVQQTLIPFQMKRHNLDVLFAPGNVCPFWGEFCRVLKINTLHHYHTPQCIGRTRSMYRKFFFAESARRATHILANTTMTKEEICRFMGIPEQKVTVAGEAFYDIYSPLSPGQAKAAMAKHGLDRDYILFISTLYPYKNTDTLIKAFAQLVEKQPSDAVLVIVGQDYDSQLPKLQALARTLGVSDKVRFLGFVATEDIPAIYSGAKVFVFPSLIETFGKPLVEAMRCGDSHRGLEYFLHTRSAGRCGTAGEPAGPSGNGGCDCAGNRRRGAATRSGRARPAASREFFLGKQRQEHPRGNRAILSGLETHARPACMGTRSLESRVSGKPKRTPARDAEHRGNQRAMKYFVTGGAGFIGSNLVDRLLSMKHEVIVYDNLSTGRSEFLDQASRTPGFALIRGDLLHPPAVVEAMRGCDFVFHLAANADVRFGTEHPRKDLEQNTIATFNVLEAMRSNGIRGIAFSSTGSIYGEPEVFPTPESVPFPVQNVVVWSF